ncbi:SHOCT domain-containing protein [Agromyces ramosus]|uniref:SHOCT domain-containing protein n=1 Tax=Agromyces ramosus TaxID=33879 RepID=A0ABU0R731_9MICO|nr:SHOCT domain-containing protein [Agromyces ramosus]MDQ0893895.1 hypothetical protein [Agromyces ramosus]
MPFRRFGRPALRIAARTAVVAGTAAVVSGGVAHHQQAKANQEYEAQQYEAMQQQAQMDAAAANAVAQQQAAMGVASQQAAVAPAAAGGTDLVAELQKLGALRDQGILSDDEFAAAKAKLLG